MGILKHKIMMKTCSHCKIEKPTTIDYFSKWSYSNDGFSNQCKTCSSERHKTYNDNQKLLPKIFYLYKITNLINEKIYYGRTDNIKRRWHLHKTLPFHIDEKKANESPKLYRSIRKYGLDNFSFEIIKTFTMEKDCKIAEIDYIKNFNTIKKGMNISEGGDGAGSGKNNPMFGKHHTDKTKKEISKILTGRKCLTTTGSKNPQSKLTEELVITIRLDFNTGKYSQRELCQKYNIPRNTMCNIINRLTWKHI